MEKGSGWYQGGWVGEIGDIGDMADITGGKRVVMQDAKP